MSSHSSHGKLICKQLEVHESNSIAFVSGANEANKITLHLAGQPTQSAQYSLPLITVNKSLLHESSALDGANLQAGSVPNSAFETAPGSGLPSGTPSQFLVYDGSSDGVAVSMSGDCSLSAAGAVTVEGNRITSAMLQDDSVSTEKIANLAVNAAKIGTSQVTASKLAPGCLDAANKFALGVVEEAALASNCVTSAKIAVGALDNADKFGSGVVNESALAANCVSSGKIALGAIDNANKFGAGVVDEGALAADCVTSGKIAVGALDNANKFGAGVVDSAALDALACTEAKLAADAVVDSKVSASAAISGEKIVPSFGAQKVETTSDVQVGSGAAFYIGAHDADGSWKIELSAGNMTFSTRVTGSYIVKQTISV